MYKKRIIAAAASTAMLSTLFLAGQTLGANRVEVKVTSEPIGAGVICDKAGGFSLGFDSNTELRDGDQITIDVNYTNAAEYVSLCKSFDILIAPGVDADISTRLNGGGAVDADGTVGFIGPDHGVGATNVGDDSSEKGPVTSINNGAISTGGDGVVFRVRGREGQQRITFDVIGIDTTDDGNGKGADPAASFLKVGPGANDNLIVRFLDQSINADFDVDGIFVDTDGDFTYDADAEVDNNTLCINVSKWSQSTVKGNMDSALDKYTFLPSDPQIAHIVSAAAYTQYECKDQNCGYLMTGTTSQSGGDSCDPFDNEGPNGVNYGDGVGYYTASNCSTLEAHYNNFLVIKNSNGEFDHQITYTVEMKILVNGAEGDNGVYFADDTLVGAQGYTSAELNCNNFAKPNPVVGGTVEYLNAGSAVLADPPDGSGCTVDVADRAVALKAENVGLNLDDNDNNVHLDIPPMRYDLSKVSDGDEVSVEVTLSKYPCGAITTVTHCIGTIKTSCPAAAGSDSLTYPYFTKAATGADAWWDGLAITNEGSSAGTATITMYENDGDKATATVNVAAHSIYVKTLGAMISDGTFVASAGNAGTLGDSTCHLVVTTTFPASGFAMIAREATGESMGYVVGTATH